MKCYDFQNSVGYHTYFHKSRALNSIRAISLLLLGSGNGGSGNRNTGFNSGSGNRNGGSGGGRRRIGVDNRGNKRLNAAS